MNTTDLDFVIDTSPLAKWVPFEGDGDAALLSRDGDYKVRVEKITPKNSKKGLGMLRVVGSIADEGDPDFGARVYGYTLIEGLDKNGEPNVRKLGDMLASLGASNEQVQGYAKKKLTTGAIIKAVTGKVCLARVVADAYEDPETGKVSVSSSVQGWISTEEYERARAAGRTRLPYKNKAKIAAALGGGTTGGGKANGASDDALGIGGPQAAAATAPAKAADDDLFGSM